MEIYYLVLVNLTKNGIPELLSVAQYEMAGRTCYDTRVYEAADYPIGEIIDLPHVCPKQI